MFGKSSSRTKRAKLPSRKAPQRSAALRRIQAAATFVVLLCIVQFYFASNSMGDDFFGSILQSSSSLSPSSSFAVWTYPFPPPREWIGSFRERVDILYCAYPSACSKILSNQTNTVGTSLIQAVEGITLDAFDPEPKFKQFIDAHYYQKILQQVDYLDHLQSVVSCLAATTYKDSRIVGAPRLLRQMCGFYNPARKGERPLVRIQSSERWNRYVLMDSPSAGRDPSIALRQLALARFLPYCEFATLENQQELSFKFIFSSKESTSTNSSKFFAVANKEQQKVLQDGESLLRLSPSGTISVFSPSIGLFHSLPETAGNEEHSRGKETLLALVPQNSLDGTDGVTRFFLEEKVPLPSATFALLQRLSKVDHVVTADRSVALVAVGMGLKTCLLAEAGACGGTESGACRVSSINGKDLSCVDLGLSNSDSVSRSRAALWGRLSDDPLVVEASHFYGSAPMRSLVDDTAAPGLDSAAPALHDTFFFIFTTKQETINWRVSRSLESVLYFHPKAHIRIYSNTLNSTNPLIQQFSAAGYDVTIRSYDICGMLNQTTLPSHLVSRFCKLLPELRTGRFWYSNETNLMRKLLLWLFGGVYCDTDIYAMRPFTRNVSNALGWQDEKEVNGAVLIFDKGHPFLYKALVEFLTGYRGPNTMWGQFGPKLLTRVLKKNAEFNKTVTLLPPETFQPIPFLKIQDCFRGPAKQYDLSKTLALHLNTKISARYTKTTPGTLCHKVLNQNCIFCK